MKIAIHYFAQLAQAAGSSCETLALAKPCSAQELVLRLATERGGRYSELLIDARGRPIPAVLLFVGGEQVAWDEPRVLGEGDEIFLATPIAGG